MGDYFSDVARYRTEMIRVLKESFPYEKSLSPLDRDVLSDRYKSILDNLNGFIVICNYTTGLYEYISDGIRTHLGYDVKKYSNEELTNFVFSIIHEDHRNFLLSYFLPVVMKYFNDNAAHITVTDYRYTCCIQTRNIYNTYLWYLIDTAIIEADVNGAPLRTLITCTNIDQIKKDDLIYYNITKKNSDGVYEIILEGVNDRSREKFQLTPREVQIINLISQGYSNQQIADKLFISLNTIKTHRKNLLKKTQCKGTAELTTFAFSRGLL